MDNKTKKIARAAIGAAALLGAARYASADFVVTLSAPTTSGGFDTYTASIINNGANGTGTQLLAVEAIITMFNGAFMRIDNSHDLGTDGVNDFDIEGLAGTPFGSNAGTFVRPPSASFAGDSENGLLDPQTTWSSYLTATSSPNSAFNPGGLYTHLSRLDVTASSNVPTGINDTTARTFANIVVPQGASFYLSGHAGGATGAAQNFNPIVPLPGPIIFLGSSAPTNTGGQITNGTLGTPDHPQGTFSPLGAATNQMIVTGGPVTYSPAFLDSLTSGTSAGFTAVKGYSGFVNAGSLPTIVLLNLKIAGADPTQAQDNSIIDNINLSNPSIFATQVDPTQANLGGVVDPWDVELIDSVSLDSGYFGFNFAVDQNDPNVTVTDIALVPEPVGAGLLLLGSLATLTRRRRNAYTSTTA